MRRETNAHQRRTRAPVIHAKGWRLMAGLAACLALAACDSNVIKHGMQFHEGDLQQIQPGMTQEQVRMNLGTPSTTAVVGTSQAYYYISSTATQTAFMLPTEQDRQVVAVYFTPGGTVERVANYGMKDGRVFDYVSRTTPAPGGKDVGIVQQLFRNLGTKQIFGD
ncbi:MAG: outer membrane protein assembly factor BamE [Hyphomicrobium sp.]|uniref:outer membrane protein assembly factor BamE n=1 Tax=Hyphomicrobium sp. TaxID=82 RepID=UPI001323E0A2|nr:outer membrane protein assembly factor BamE [Hyphomicrobium sp.]KAB2943642.1 MAG: outer membrane protein assembly factor BamE [Hyphomicrobium sp.]MBZ0210659.1 outer membrane protein assembly factor BamE [Hyphomicrobium sp.]